MRFIASLIKKGSNVADIGTDHAYLPIYLIEHNLAKKVVAVDINEGPLHKAANNIKKNKNIMVLQSDGLEKLEPSDFDTLVIAGMGGETIAGILDSEKINSEHILILQPSSKTERLLDFLNKNGFSVLSQQIIKSCGRYYPVITSIKSESKPSDLPLFNIIAGLDKDKNREYLLKKLSVIKKQASSIENIERKASEHKKLLTTIIELKKVLNIAD